jgi:hypothetical protein
MYHAPRAVTPLNPETVQVGQAVGQQAQRYNSSSCKPGRRTPTPSPEPSTIARLKRELGEPPLIQTTPGLGYKSPALTTCGYDYRAHNSANSKEDDDRVDPGGNVGGGKDNQGWRERHVAGQRAKPIDHGYSNQYGYGQV